MERHLRLWVAALCLLLGACAGAPPAREAEAPPPAAVPEPAPAVAPAPTVSERPAVDRVPERPAPRQEVARPLPPAPPPAAPVRGEPFVCPPGDTVTARKRWLNAVNALQGGDVAGAHTELQLALCREPENKTALALLQQIDQPPEALFGPEWTEYTVLPGDTLSKISEKFLGDPLLFYGVARYNRIENPSLLKAGQVVRVPRSRAPAPPAAHPPPPPAPPPPAAALPPIIPKEPAVPAPAAPADRMAPSASAIPTGGIFEGSVTVILSASDDTDPAPVIRYTLDGTAPDAGARVYDGPLRLEKTATLRYAAWDASGNVSATRAETYTIQVPEQYREERQWIARGEYARALASLEAALARDAGDPQARELLVSACLSHARDLGTQGRWEQAQAVLQRAAAAAPGDPGVQAQLREAEKRVGVEQIYENGVRAAQMGEPEKAYSAFRKALELDPDHGPAKEGLAQVRRDAVEVHSKRALAAFRRQELDVAIAEWDQALAIDPDNELAKLRRAEAVDLKARFEQLQKKGGQ